MYLYSLQIKGDCKKQVEVAGKKMALPQKGGGGVQSGEPQFLSGHLLN
jgi:hypothetical protein